LKVYVCIWQACDANKVTTVRQTNKAVFSLAAFEPVKRNWN